MGDGPGYNPYRKSNGEFASKDEVGSLEEKLSGDLAAAQSSGDDALEAQIKSYAMDKLPESDLGRKLLEDSYGTSATRSKSSAYGKLGARELQKLAKDTDDPELQLEIARRGNSAARKNLARNASASSEALALAYDSTDDDSVRREIAVNANSDLARMEPVHAAHGIGESVHRSRQGATREVRDRYRRRAEELQSANWIDDRTVQALRDRWQSESGDARSAYRSEDPAVDRIMANPSNEVSEDLALEYAQSSPLAASIALESGRINPDRLGELHPGAARFSKVTDENTLREAARLASRGHWDQLEYDPWNRPDPTGRPGRDAVRSIVDNPSTPIDALTRFAGNGRADQLALYRHPNATLELKKSLENASPVVRSELRLEKAQGGRDRSELRSELIVSGEQTDTRRGYHSADYTLDRKKIEEYRLSARDVERLMGSGVGYRYDPETGRYGGSYDSGD